MSDENTAGIINGDDMILTNRDLLISEYVKASGLSGKPFVAKSRSMISTLAVKFDRTEFFPATPPATMGYFVAQPQALEWFSYGVGNNIDAGYAVGTNNPFQRTATDADTNLGKPRQTNGVEEMVIESVSLTCPSIRAAWVPSTNGVDPPSAEFPTNANNKQAMSGQIPLKDPGALIAPPQLYSPFNLENAVMDLIMSQMSFEFQWNRTNIIKVGRIDQLPEGGRKSYLQAGGVPSSENRYQVPEGFTWRKAGKPDSDMVVVGRLQQPICIPVNAVPVNGFDTARLPSSFWVDITLRVHGMAFNDPSGNAA